MAKQSHWPTIHAERQALAADLEGLSDEQWATPSLCQGWTVQQVLGHMTATAKLTTTGFLKDLVSSRFRFDAMADKDVARETAGGPGPTLARFKEQITSSTSPPGPADTWLGEVIVHAEDIRRPLGIKHDYSPEALARVADFYRKGNLIIGGKRRVEGLALRATDTAWSRGSGPEVAGPAVSLVLAISGRPEALDDLSGEGVSTLASRMK
jgi:uncharacterized protein (TIGR03083 family)